ncbi:TolC family protein [Deminuibacter soli]|uniref:TolC family protein n=1 Tax=Deminuibacter soli TaxID=2291815 RepID=A0A3E1NGS1_9BACT|nr:TolC family protein [Deminuibacter soli]RFM27149.1 TolC family protein [Deminuibacter soli]
MRHLLFCWLLVSPLLLAAQTGIRFHSPGDVFSYADSHSATFKNATQQNILAKYQTMAAKLAQWNVQGDATFTATDNTKLPTNFLPAQIFGGEPGKFQPITLGQKYVTAIVFNPQIDILNPYAAAKVQLSKANEQLTTLNNLLTKKSLYESIAAAYYNIQSYYWQANITRQSLLVADTLTQIMLNKQQQGIARSQDVNNAQANQLATQDKLQQLEVQLAQQYYSLKLLCDINPDSVVVLTDTLLPEPAFDASMVPAGHLQQQQTLQQQRYQEADLRAEKRWFMPTLSFVGYLAWQQNTNNAFFDNTRWLGANYVGLKLKMPLLPDANKVAAVKYARINLVVANTNAQHAALQDSISNRQLGLDYQKAYSSYRLAQKVAVLKQDSYYKNLNIYREGILSATDMLNSFSDWLNSSLNTAAQLAGSEYQKTKIQINNTIQ